MGNPWFTKPAASGEVALIWRKGNWYVKSPDIDSDVKCLLQGDFEINPDNGHARLHGTVSKYIRGKGEMPDFLHLRSEEYTESTNKKNTESSNSTSSPSATSSGDSSTGHTSSRPNPSGTKQNLDRIAKDQIGNEQFTITQENRESTIEKAKKRARKQQRDPAIDPRLQSDKEDND